MGSWVSWGFLGGSWGVLGGFLGVSGVSGVSGFGVRLGWLVVCCGCVYFCCTLDFDTFSKDAIDGERQHCSLRGHSSHDEWVNTVPGTMS